MEKQVSKVRVDSGLRQTAQTPQWRFLAATAAAPRKRPARGDDALDVAEVRSAHGVWLIACCADGAGSASHGALGAQVAVDGAMAWMRRVLAGKRGFQKSFRIKELSRLVRRLLESSAARAKVPTRELATTLVCVAVGQEQTLVAQVGDAAAVLRVGASAPWEVALWPERGEYANTTHFATDASAPWRSVVMAPVVAVALTTDGLLPLAFDVAARRPFSPFFDSLFAEMSAGDPSLLQPHLQAFLESPRVGERTDDDVSLILAVRIGSL